MKIFQEKSAALSVLICFYSGLGLTAVSIILVMPNGRATANPPTSNFMSDFDYYADFEKDLLQDLMPYIESHFSVKTDRD